MYIYCHCRCRWFLLPPGWWWYNILFIHPNIIFIWHFAFDSFHLWQIKLMCGKIASSYSNTHCTVYIHLFLATKYFLIGIKSKYIALKWITIISNEFSTNTVHLIFHLQRRYMLMRWHDKFHLMWLIKMIKICMRMKHITV